MNEVNNETIKKAELQKERIINYFEPSQSIALEIGGIIFGVIMIIVLYNSNFYNVSRPIAMILVAVIGAAISLFKKTSNRASQSEVMEIIDEKSKGIAFKALKALRINQEMVKERQPILIRDFVYDNALIKEVGYQKYISSKYQIVIIFFSDSSLYCYKYTFRITDWLEKEVCKEYSYKNIQGVYSDVAQATYQLAKEKTITFNHEMLKVVPTSGEVFSCIIPSGDMNLKSHINQMGAFVQGKKRD